jgi:toxin ParE1/3/4
VKLPARLRSAAEDDVLRCARYLQEQSEAAGIKFLDAFDGTLRLLENSPGIGGACRFKNPLFDRVRVWRVAGFKSYLIFYRILADELEVVRVLHGARDLGSIFGEGDE